MRPDWILMLLLVMVTCSTFMLHRHLPKTPERQKPTTVYYVKITSDATSTYDNIVHPYTTITKECKDTFKNIKGLTPEWCTFIAFLKQCEHSHRTLCVYHEDPLYVPFHTIQHIIDSYKFHTPALRLSIRGKLMVFQTNLLHIIVNTIRRHGIMLDMNTFLDNNGLVTIRTPLFGSHLPPPKPVKPVVKPVIKPVKPVKTPLLRHKKTVMVGMSTHNRPGYVQLSLKALRESKHDAHVYIFDDVSTEITKKELEQWSGSQMVLLNNNKKGPDAMARHILETFISKKYDILVLLDSDMVVSPNWWDALHEGLKHSTGLMSLYRSAAPKHRSNICTKYLCKMPSMGNAGTVWRRALAEKMLSEMSARKGGFDWGWSEWCVKNKIPMEALKESAVLHIGMHGSWSHETTAEKSVGFYMDKLSQYIRQKAEYFLNGAKPIKQPKAVETSSKPQKTDILWLVGTYKRAWSLDIVLQSLVSQSHILVSKDARSKEVDDVLRKYDVEIMEHPWSCSIHPNRFPAKDDTLNENYKGDTYGNPRSSWATCLKHAWWWMMNQAWSRNPKRVCVIDDDTVVHPDAFAWLSKTSGHVKLTPENMCVPWCMSAKEWSNIDPKTFCEYDDYNWDQSIAWVFKTFNTAPATVPSKPLSMHIGECGGWDVGGGVGRDKTCTPEKVAAIRTHVNQWMAKSVSATYTKKQWLTLHKQKNGGWAHPKDHEHCLEVAGRLSTHTTSKSEKYVVVMPSVKRHNNEYLKQTLESLHVVKPTNVPVLLVNGNQPAEAHTFLVEWCTHHTQYECIEPPPVSESLIQDAIRLDKRGDTAHFLRWRTMENMHALFGLEKALTKNTKYIIWIEDDVIVPKIFFDALEPGEVICLRDGKEWCGSTAYLFSRHFVEQLIQDIETQKLTMPIDWIIFDPRPPEAKHHVPKRIPLAHHIGEVSTKHSTRNIKKDLATKTIQTADLFANIDYDAPENAGPWKQGWDYDYDGRFKDGLTVHVVPHSQNDPGWIKTYHTYYSTQTKHILDTVIAALDEDPRRTFIWAEISYFSLWWGDATPEQKTLAKQFVADKRLDFVTGGWVMNDEASVTARATRWHLQEGRQWLKDTFGVTPHYSWAIDPFGHSAGQAQVLKELGYKGMLIQRVHYAVKKQLAKSQQLEFQWQTPAGEIFTHMMPFYSYDGPHTCGPDPSVCCQFDFARIKKGKTWSGCPWGKMAVEITEQNVAERSRTWLNQVYKKAMLYRGKHVLIPVGDDFRYQTMDEAHKQYRNYQKMFDWIKVNVPTVKVSFSTLTRYFDAVRETNVPKLQGSFFPYSDREKDYWTGYFNSRIFYKGYDRLLESLIAAVETKCPSVDIHLQKRALGLFQHHDGITGTAKSHVVQDYYKTMQKAVTELQSKLKSCLDIAAHVIVNPLSIDTPTMKANEIRIYEDNKCVPKNIIFEHIKLDEHGHIIQIDDTPIHESFVWRSNKPGPGVAGAYLMAVTDEKNTLTPIKHTMCVAKQYKQVETTFDMLKRSIRVYNDGTIEFIYDVDIHARNNGELWVVYKPEWTAERLCSDVHGLTWECHVERKDAPLQAKFWPMPTMAWLASSSERLTFTGAQPTGVGFHEGAMVLMLDRRGNQDDARGLGQGITDSRPVEMRFGVLMEKENLKQKASDKALSIRNWMLNPQIGLV